NRVLPGDQLQTGLGSLLEELLGNSSAVLRITLKGLRELSLKGFSDALSRSEDLYRDELLHTHDIEEGIRAFIEQRSPRWMHRTRISTMLKWQSYKLRFGLVKSRVFHALD